MTQPYQYIRFLLQLSYEQYLKVYQGSKQHISVIADDGRRINFPARNIQSFLSKGGVQGHFEMKLTAENKFVSIKKLEGNVP